MPLDDAPSIKELQQQWRQNTYDHIDEKKKSEEKHGYAGLQNTVTGLWEMGVPTRAGNYGYVTVVENSPSAPIEAIFAGVVPKPGTPVIARQTKTGWIAEADHEAMQTFSPNANLGVAKHSHRLGLGNEDLVEGLRFEPANPHIASGGNSLFIRVEPGFYRYNGADVAWLGNAIDLTSYVPSTAGTWAWVKVGIDPTTNTLVAKTGAEYSKAFVIGATQLAPIAFDSNDTLVVRICGVRLRNGQTAIADYRDFMDLRMYISGQNAPSSGGGGDDAYFLSWSGFS